MRAAAPDLGLGGPRLGGGLAAAFQSVIGGRHRMALCRESAGARDLLSRGSPQGPWGVTIAFSVFVYFNWNEWGLITGTSIRSSRTSALHFVVSLLKEEGD